ncbi:MAG: DnaJ domain-containing protein [bacterium]|nr:DnaJ domain-containing protein [bacterium]
MAEYRDYYLILQINPDADSNMIRRAYRLLALRYHPDRKEGDERKMVEITEAYNVLMDSEKRKQFDRDYYGRKNVYVYSYEFKTDEEEIKKRVKEREEYYRKKEQEMFQEMIKEKRRFEIEKKEKTKQKDINERIELFFRIIKDPRNSIQFRWKAKMKLVEIGEPAVMPLINELKSKNHEVRYFAVVALGEIRDKRAIEPLMEMLEDKWELIRSYAAEGLGRLKDKKVIPALLDLYYNDQEVDDVKFHIRNALEALEYEFEEEKVKQENSA